MDKHFSALRKDCKIIDIKRGDWKHCTAFFASKETIHVVLVNAFALKYLTIVGVWLLFLSLLQIKMCCPLLLVAQKSPHSGEKNPDDSIRTVSCKNVQSESTLSSFCPSLLYLETVDSAFAV